MERLVQRQIVNDLTEMDKRLQEAASPTVAVQCLSVLAAVQQRLAADFTADRQAVYVPMLEGAAEGLDALAMQGLGAADRAEIAALVRQLLAALHRELAQEPVKKEILFLPYKASMWDCLESIWMAADADKEHCIARVMPIPYCDRNPDNTVRAWHYDGGQFPDYVRITDYRQYDIAEHHPDIIYIHNPYDDHNLMTTVDMRYYSYELKKQTDMLVYVPYFFVGSNIFPRGQVLPEYCYPHIDKMIVQKEGLLVQEVDGTSENPDGIRKPIEDYIAAAKLVPLGSPKADRVFYCMQHPHVPQEWRKKLRGKKVFLYNVSISGIITYGAEALAKIRYVFGCFAAHPEVILLYRPHPLLEASLAAMKPELYESYMQLKQEFLDKGWGILDTTPDIDMAVAISDAYVGEAGSSVPALFGIAGKPVFFIDPREIHRSQTLAERTSVTLAGVYPDNKGGVWCILANFPLLVHLDFATGRLEPLYQFEKTGDYWCCFPKGDKIILSPHNMPYFREYDCRTGQCEITAELEEPLEQANFGGGVPYGKYIFFLPSKYPAIVRYDTETHALKYYRQCMEEFAERMPEEYDDFWGGGGMRGDHIMLRASIHTNVILEFDMATEEYRFHQVADDEDGILGMVPTGDGHSWWLLPWELGPIRRWDIETGAVQCYDGWPEGFAVEPNWWNPDDQPPFWGMWPVAEKLWIFPRFANMVVEFDPATGQMQEAPLKLSHTLAERKEGIYKQQVPFNAAFWLDLKPDWWQTWPDRLGLMDSFDRSLLFVDRRTGQVTPHPACYIREDLARDMSAGLEFKDRPGISPFAASEGGPWNGLGDFIAYVSAGRHEIAPEQAAYAAILNNADGTCGQKIHEYILQAHR